MVLATACSQQTTASSAPSASAASSATHTQSPTPATSSAAPSTKPTPLPSPPPKPPVKVAASPLPKACQGLTGQTICLSKRAKTLYAIVGLRIIRSGSARFGGIASDGSGPWFTREGTFHTFWKALNPKSTLYHVYMPYFMAFSGGEGIHYSSEYAQSGYSHSHGCVGLKSLSLAKWLYAWAPLGIRVVVTAG